MQAIKIFDNMILFFKRKLTKTAISLTIFDDTVKNFVFVNVII